MFIGNDPVTDETMVTALNALTEGKKDTTIFFRADKTVDYETLMKVMDTLHQAGYLKIGWSAKKLPKRNKNDARLLFTTGHFFSLNARRRTRHALLRSRSSTPDLPDKHIQGPVPPVARHASSAFSDQTAGSYPASVRRKFAVLSRSGWRNNIHPNTFLCDLFCGPRL